MHSLAISRRKRQYRTRQLMNVRTLCLAILHFSEATGYEIKKMSTEEHFSFFVDASFGSIYPALSRLQDDGCVTVREEFESGKPSRKVYSITDKGRQELHESLRVLPRRDSFKSEFLLMAMCAEILDREMIVRAIDRHLKDMEAEIEMLNQVLEHCDDTSGGKIWVAKFGRQVKQQALDYFIKHRHELEALVPDNQAQAAE